METEHVFTTEELQKIAERGESAGRLLENDDFKRCVKAFCAKCMAEEARMMPGQADLWRLKRMERVAIDELHRFLDGVQAEGEAARCDLNGEDTGRKVLISG